MAVKKDMTRGGLVRRKKSLERLADLKTRRLAAALADMTDSDLDRVAELMMKVMPDVVGHVVAESGLRRIEQRKRLGEKREGGT